MTDAARRQRLALWVAFGIILVWGSNFSVQKAVFDVAGPAGFLMARYLLMPVCAVLLLLWRYGGHWPKVPRADLFALFRLGFLGHLVHTGLSVWGIHWSTPFSSSLLLACGPVFTLLILRWLGVETLRRAQVMGVAIACAGVLLFMSDKLLANRWEATGGDLVLLLAASLFSYYTVTAKPLIERHGGIVVMSYAVLLISPLAALAWLPAGLQVPWGLLPASIWLALLWSVVVPTFLGWLLWGWINAVRGVARTAPLMYLMPPVAGLVAWIVADEGYTTTKLAGAAMTLAGVAYAQFGAQGLAPPRSTPANVAAAVAKRESA